MKTPFSLVITASLASALFITSCTKENPSEMMNASVNSQSADDATVAADRIDAIVKDLSLSSYSLSFSKPIPAGGITKTAYGADNYLAFADPQDLICGDPIRSKYKQIPIWKRPNIIWPTCPDMVLDLNKLTQIQDVLVKADYKQFGALKQIKFLSGGGFLANSNFTNQFPAMKLDKVDDAIGGFSGEQFLILNAPGNYGTGATRSFYGYADLNKIVFQPYKKNLRDLLKPTLKGCYDPIVLSGIKEKLQGIDPSYYKSLTVTYLPENKSIGILSMN